MQPNFRSVHLNRIHWAIFSPALMDYPFSVNYVRDEAHRESLENLLSSLESNSSEVDQHFNPLGNLPMGKYFEQLVFFMLKHDNRYELLLANHQIREGNRTVGELDLIVKDVQTRKREHWEIALKFYLQCDESPKHQKLIGPNAVDNLGRKMEKLTKRQMPLSNHSSVKYLVGAEKTEPKLFLKGQLFYRLGKTSILPSHSNPNHEKRWWCYTSEVDEMISDELKWCILEKPNWIGIYQQQTDALSSDEIKSMLQTHFESQNSSVLIAGMSKTENAWIEQTRGFVVNNNWPRIIHLN